MYCDFFGLRCRPFEDRADTQFCYAYPDWDEALAATIYDLHHGRGIALVLGESGTGKTLLIRSLFHRIHTSDRVIVLTWSSVSGMDLMREACKAFGITLPEADHHIRYYTRLRRHLVRTALKGQRSVLIIDQAENLTDDNLDQITALSELQHDGGNLLSIALVAQPKLRLSLDDPKHERIAQRLSGERALRALTERETREYIQHRLRIAGAVDGGLFADEAIAMIHDVSRGVPRLINRTADAAMLGAYGADQRRITTALVAETIGDKQLIERTADARALGVSTTEHVAAGLLEERRAQVLPEKASPERTSDGVATAAIGSVQTSHSPGGGVDSMHLRRGPAGTAPPPPSDWGLTEPDSYDSDVDSFDLPLNRTESVLGSAETQLRCLERACARAERLSATTDASLAKYSAAERHLASLIRDADGLVAGMTNAIRDASSSVDRLKHRSDQMLGEADVRLKSIEAQSGEAAEVSSDIDEQKRRVEEVCAHADQVESRLRSTAEQIADKADELQQRITLLMGGLESAEKVQEQLDAQLSQVPIASGEVDEKVGQLRDMLANADTSARETIASTKTQLDDACRRAASIEAEAEQTVSAVKNEVGQVLDTTKVEIEQAIVAVKTDAEQTIETAKSEAGQTISALQVAVDQAREKAEEFQGTLMNEALTRFQAGLKERFEAEMQARNEAMERNIAMYRATLVEIVDDCKRQIANLGEAATVCRRRTDDSVAESQRAFTAMEASVAAKTEGLRREIESLSARRDELQSLLSTTAEELKATEKRAGGLTEGVKQAETVITELTDRATAAQSDLAPTVQRCERLIGAVQSTHGELDAMQHGIASTLIELGSAGERADLLQQQIARSEQSASGLATLRTEAARLKQDLEDATGRARESIQATRQAVADVSGQCEHLAEQSTVAGGVLQELSTANEAGTAIIEQAKQAENATNQASGTAREQVAELSAMQASIQPLLHELDGIVVSAKRLREETRTTLADADVRADRLDAQIKAATRVLGDVTEANETNCAFLEQARNAGEAVSAAAKQAEERAEHLDTTLATANQATEQLDELARSARQLYESMQGVVAHVDEKVGQIDSHQAAAKHLLRQLTEASVAGHNLAEHIEGTVRTFEEKANETTRLVEDRIREIQTIATEAEESTGQLRDCNELAVQLVEKLDTAHGPAKDSADQLQRNVDEARQVINVLAERYGQVRELPSRLRHVIRVLKAARTTGATIEGTANDAKNTLQELKITTERAATQDAAMQELTKVTQQAIETLQELTPASKQAVEELESRIAVAEHAADSSEPILSEFIKQAQALALQLTELQTVAVNVEERVTEATAKPAELIEASQTQAAQLERVCGGVQKVLKALSQATADAKKRASTCQAAADSTTTRLTELSAETNRATITLHEWVEEALRVQSRLEKTLCECPSIKATHPGGDVRRVANIIQRPDRIANPSASQLTMLKEPARKPGTEEEQQPRKTSRPEEIANLIEEAKCAVATIKT